MKKPKAIGHWIDLRKQKPEMGSRVLACDEYGYVCIKNVDVIINKHLGELTWIESYKFGNGSELVAWMPLPKWPKELCSEDADGSMP